MALAGDTKEKIRVAAEELFARNGFHNTSLRTITSAAQVNLAAVNYHYGSKESLLEAIFDYHLLPLNSLRQDRLLALQQQGEDSGKAPELEAVLRAFIEPSMAFRADKKARAAFIALIGQAIHAPDDTLRHIFFVRVSPVVDLFAKLLGQALPQLPPNHLNRTLAFILGAMNAPVIPAQGQSLGQAGAVIDSSVDVEFLIDFIIHGLGHRQS